MPVKPAPVWGQTLEKKIKESFDNVDKKIVPGLLATGKAYQSWINENAVGISTLPPFAGSNGTNTAGAFNPVIFGVPGDPVSAAAIMSTAWFAWYMAITWTPIPPVPPFSAIALVSSSPVGAAAAQALLLAGLLAEFALVPPIPALGKTKYPRIAQLFYTATTTAGVMITGLGIGAPPPPLILPLHPAM